MKSSLPNEIAADVIACLERLTVEVLPAAGEARLEGAESTIKAAHRNVQENADGTVRRSSLEGTRLYFRNRFQQVQKIAA